MRTILKAAAAVALLAGLFAACDTNDGETQYDYYVYVALSGASSGETERTNMSLLGSLHVSSRMPPSKLI